MKRKITTLFTALFMAVIALFAAACGNTGGAATASVVQTTETLVVIAVEETDGNATLYDVLIALKEKGEITLESENTAYGQSITSINGKPAQDTYYWASYITDAEMGTDSPFTWNEKTFYYASFGIGSLQVKAGCYYAFSYESWVQQ